MADMQHVSQHTGPVAAVPGHPRQVAVMRSVAFLRANIGEPVTIGRLSRVAGVSQRTLRYAFQEVCGVSPKRFALRQRLRAAREALRTANPDQTTVTDVATLYGFFELGRFAGQYKAAFGETPSRTLRAQIRHRLQQAG